jgi:glycosyltransferase involved in cell wall biosynthesis
MSSPPLRPLPGVSICAPAWNEEANLTAFLDDCRAALDGGPAPLDYEVLVLDDGSRDRTGAILDERAADWPALRPLRHASNRGIAASLRTLYAAATHPYVFLIGADGQWRCADLWPMLDAYRAGADVVVGVRRDKAAIYTPFRRAVSAAYRHLTRVAFGVDLHDAGSLKLAPRAVFARALVSDSVFADAERLLRAARAGQRLAFVPCEFHPRRAGVATGARPAVVARAARDLVRTFVALRLRADDAGGDGGDDGDGDGGDARRGPR